MTPETIIAATLGPLVLLIVQALKNLIPSIEKKAIPITIILSAGFATLLVDWSTLWQTSLIELATYTLGIAGVASGVYSWKKKVNKIEIPDYSDEK